MGYCFDKEGRLCCAFCGAAGAKKYPCPFGWCPPAAACSECREKYSQQFQEEWHRQYGCEENHIRFEVEQREEKRLLDEGHSIRRAACIHYIDAEQFVHVLFSFANGTTVGYYMAPDVYHAISLSTPATPDMFREHGVLYEAPARFENGAVSKAV